MVVFQQMDSRLRAMAQAPHECIQRFAESFHGFHRNLVMLQERVARYTQMLKALSPEATLTRGYSITLFRGKVVTSVRNVKKGDEVTTRVKDGSIESVIQ